MTSHNECGLFFLKIFINLIDCTDKANVEFLQSPVDTITYCQICRKKSPRLDETSFLISDIDIIKSQIVVFMIEVTFDVISSTNLD